MRRSASKGRTGMRRAALHLVRTVLPGAAAVLLVLAPAHAWAATRPVALHLSHPASSVNGPSVCNLLVAKTVAMLAKETVGKSADTALYTVISFSTSGERRATGNKCTYATSSNPANPSLQVTLFVTNAAANYALFWSQDKAYSRVVTVSGATNAFFDPDFGVDVLWGSRQILVQGTPGDSDSPPSPIEDIAVARALMTAL